MIEFKPKGAIFDVDDTLLDNQGDVPGHGLHELSRLEAAHEVGKRHHIAALESLSPHDNWRAFRDASTHSLVGAVWNTLVICGLRDGSVPDQNDPLLQEMVELKMALHEDVILREGKAYPGAIEFVAALANGGLRDKLAVATTAYLRDLNIFFTKSGLDKYFPKERIISLESVTHAKPDPEAFNLAFATLDLPESDRRFVCAFEDNPRGITSAKGAGLYVCAITNIFSKSELESLDSPPDMIAGSFYELIAEFGLQI